MYGSGPTLCQTYYFEIIVPFYLFLYICLCILYCISYICICIQYCVILSFLISVSVSCIVSLISVSSIYLVVPLISTGFLIISAIEEEYIIIIIIINLSLSVLSIGDVLVYGVCYLYYEYVVSF